MIGSFKCPDTESLHDARRVARFVNIERVALRKLRQLEIAVRLDDLKIPPQNRLELLKGKRKGQYSIRVNDQWRLCFIWKDGAAFEIEIVDYHS
ncbi:plasmid maintenance system killer protein [Herbaspirillum frisingense GSF30]|uniref:Plasmid maintenance system killer protein n=1 Tax=Herbaspirillum frisingense GSF30 TaxID=864073 RepID=A0AAI9IAX3_9BURK|nr:type II toxin-antitoxin system RelE/ParE family toxin [Herbaspirillum frisingense]EOA02777.1 plasmid maintenance system killer protein [Herbaspirillum frisingense GSF30]